MKDQHEHEAEIQQQTDATHKKSGSFKFALGIRHYQSGLLFLLLLVGYALRVNMSVGIVAMVDSTNANPDFEEYDWNEQTQSLILSSFFWGYILIQLPAGTWARKFGPKILLSVSMGACALLTLLTPVAANLGGWVAVVALRILLGVSQGFIFPCVHSLLATWVPPSERSRLGTFVYAGSPLGNVIMLAISGQLASSPLGWPSIFYVSGVIGVIWTALFFAFGSNSPEVDTRITDEERTFIQESLGQETNIEEIKKLQTPWKRIFSSLPFISLIVAHSAQNWGFWTLLTEIPTYMKNVLDMDIKKNSLLSALPYLVMWLGSFVFSPISDFLINRGYLSIGNARKLFNSIGLYFPMFALIGLGYVTKEHTEIAVFLLTFAVGINSGTYVGFMLNHMDLSPVYAGTLMGITNFSANIMSILGPLFVGLIVSDAFITWKADEVAKSAESFLVYHKFGHQLVGDNPDKDKVIADFQSRLRGKLNNKNLGQYVKAFMSRKDLSLKSCKVDILLITGMLSPYATVVEKLFRDLDKEKVTMLKIERAGDVLADTPAKVAQSILLFCKGQGQLTSVVMPGVDRSRAYSTSSGGSNDGNTPVGALSRRLSRGMSMEEYDKPNIRRLSITVNDQLPPVKK